MPEDCPSCRARKVADALAASLAAPTGLPPEAIQMFIEGTTTGAVAAAKAPKGRKVSAYSKAYGRAYKRLKKKHTLKNGKMRKGWNHKRLVKAAHAETKKTRGGKR